MKRAIPALLMLCFPLLSQESAPVLAGVRAEITARDGVKALREGRAEDALRLLELARSYDEHNPYISYDIARAAAAGDDPQRALGELQRTLEDLPPGKTEKPGPLKELRAAALYNRGVLLARTGSLQEALEAFKQCLDADPADQDAAFNSLLLTRILEARKKQKKQNEESRNKLQEIARRILELVDRQGRLVASLWAAQPEIAPKEAAAARRANAPGRDLMAEASMLLMEALADGDKSKDISGKLDAAKVSAWIARVFCPREAMETPAIADAEGAIRDDAHSLAEEAAGLSEDLAGGKPAVNAQGQAAVNPMAAALRHTALHLGMGAEFAGGAAGYLAGSDAVPPDVPKAAGGMVPVERSFLLALLPFVQPPQQKQQKQQSSSEGDEREKDKEEQPEQEQEQTGRKQESPAARQEQKQAEKEAKQGEERKISPEEARRLLKALRESDKEALKELLERRAVHRGETQVEKDW